MLLIPGPFARGFAGVRPSGGPPPDFELTAEGYASTEDLLSYRTEGNDGAGSNAGAPNNPIGAYNYNVSCGGARTRIIRRTGLNIEGLTTSFRSEFDSLAACTLAQQQANYGVQLATHPPTLASRTSVWYEVLLMFDENWRTDPGVDPGGNSPDHKTVLFWMGSGARFETKIGTWGNVVYVGQPGSEPGAPSEHSISGGPSHWSVNPLTFWVGLPFRLRMEMHIGTNVPFRVWMQHPVTQAIELIHQETIASVGSTFSRVTCGSNRNNGVLVNTGFDRIRERFWWSTNPGWAA